ncbi:MAG TPA: hypothetical protein VD731_05920 [Nitrosopumilaceae archaeon]|nr:hypothetical protein [Nitrosopumilaceae archaeon]
MTLKLGSFLLSPILIIFLIHSSYAVSVEAESSWDEESLINISVIGDSVINLDSNNKLLRAYVDIVNHNPADGYYYLRIIQPGTEKIISEEEIIIRKKGNDKAGADVAHMFNDEEISNNGNFILGDYILEVFSENGAAIGNTKFSIIKPSVSNLSSESESMEQNDNTITNVENVPIPETIVTDKPLPNIKKIPDWVKNIFILYVDDNISEDELISALKFLIEAEIILVN